MCSIKLVNQVQKHFQFLSRTASNTYQMETTNPSKLAPPPPELDGSVLDGSVLDGSVHVSTQDSGFKIGSLLEEARVILG